MIDGSPIIERFAASDVTPPRAEVLRLLGVRRGAEPRRSVQAMLDEELRAAPSSLKARVVMRGSETGIAGARGVEATSPEVAAVCTIGSELEERAASLLDRGQSARAVVVDAVASAAVESLAEVCDQRICRWAHETGRTTGRRRSPGYGAWSLEDQRAIFDFLEPNVVGVTLTERFMMVPRKTISFAVLIDEGGERDDDRCRHCDLKGCLYRAEQGDARRHA